MQQDRETHGTDVCLLCGTELMRPSTGGRVPKFCSAQHRAQYNRQKKRDEALAQARHTGNGIPALRFPLDEDPDPHELVEAFSTTLTTIRRLGDLIGTQLLTYEPSEVSARLAEADSRIASMQSRIRQLESAAKAVGEDAEARAIEIQALTVRAEEAEEQLENAEAMVDQLRAELVDLKQRTGAERESLLTQIADIDQARSEALADAEHERERAERAERSLEQARRETTDAVSLAMSQAKQLAEDELAAERNRHTEQLHRVEERAAAALQAARQEMHDRVDELRTEFDQRLRDQQHAADRVLAGERDLRTQVVSERDRLYRDVDRLTDALTASATARLAGRLAENATHVSDESLDWPVDHVTSTTDR